MMKHFKKLALVTTAVFTLLLTMEGETIASLPLPSITEEYDEDTETTPISEESGICPLVDEDDENDTAKTR